MNRAATAVAGTLLFLAPLASAEQEPWSDQDPPEPTKRLEAGDYGFKGGAEYRANWLYVNPLDLSGTRYRKGSWIEHRLRLDGAVDYKDKVRLIVSIDGLDGVLWGDNGTFGGSPSPNSGARVSAAIPNSARPVVGFKEGTDPNDPDNYGYTLAPVEELQLRRAYGEVVTPIGLLRIGRQPSTQGTSLLVADGDGRPNRFGFSRKGDSSDRILFATKPLEGGKPPHLRDTSPDRGFFFVLFYDRVVSNDPQIFGDDLHNVGVNLRLLQPDSTVGKDAHVSTTYVHRWDRDFETYIHSFGLRAYTTFGDLTVGAEGAGILGRTREVSEALARIKNDPVVVQDVTQWGARAVVRYDQPKWTAYFEVDYASGDDDPATGSPLTQFTWAEDTNVGLLMFEQTLAFESARSAAAGVALLRSVGATTFPAERVDTEGSFTNALALFPQLNVRPHQNVLLRGGVLLAWATEALTDAIASLNRKDGDRVDDDVVNFHGGKPGHFYGVELDLRVQWRFQEHFAFDLEAAQLFPGDAFEDENQQAVSSTLVQGRTTFFF